MSSATHRWAILVEALAVLGMSACAVAGPASTPRPSSTSLPPASPPTSLPTVSRSATDQGEPVHVYGVLDAVGKPPHVQFVLRTEDGSRLDVLPWLPVEVMHPPDGKPAPPTMADWVGQKVVLEGTWVQTENGRELQVTSAELQ